MEAEGAVEVEDFLRAEGDGRAQGGVVRIAKGDDDVEAIRGTALEEDDEFFREAAAVVACARTERVRKAGMVEVPMRARAPPRMKPRRVMRRGARSRPCRSQPQSVVSCMLLRRVVIGRPRLIQEMTVVAPG